MSQSAFQRLEGLERFGIKLGLENIRILLQAMGNPQDSFPSVLIAGTNGKGSVGTMLHTILQQNGFYSAHYTSPHLIDICERIRVGNQLISSMEFVSALDFVFQTIDRLLASGQMKILPTYFEAVTATAFHHFRERQVDYAIVEVGLGGRFDATNVIQQQLSIITSIDYDHEEYLGESLKEIASEKAGILKPGVPLVSGPLPPESISVISDAVIKNNCVWRQVDPAALQDLRLNDGFPVFWYEPWKQTMRINLRGKHQAWNAAVALLACDLLKSLGLKMEYEKVEMALNQLSWPGRLELLPFEPPVLLDCAHNPGGVDALSRFLDDQGWKQIVVLFTAMRDKRIGSMLKRVSQKTETIFLTRVEPFSRCADMEQLSEASSGFRSVIQEPNAELAWKNAVAHSKSIRCPLVVFGSMYLIGKILFILKENKTP